MLLVADVGNTNITFGAFGHKGYEKLIGQWRLSTDRRRTMEEYAAQIRDALEHQALTAGLVDQLSFQNLKAVAIASGVPEVTATLGRVCEHYLFGIAPTIVTSTSAHGLEFALEHREQVGVDRVVNAIAAWEKLGRACVIVDMGTATTIDVVDGDGRFAGGAILPGIHTALAGLAARAPRLPAIEVAEPLHAIGRDTVEAM